MHALYILSCTIPQLLQVSLSRYADIYEFSIYICKLSSFDTLIFHSALIISDDL